MTYFLQHDEETSKATRLTSADLVTTKRYGILVDTEKKAIVVMAFSHHQELLDMILSDLYQHLVLYRTQYHLPTDQELEDLSSRLFPK